VVGQQGVQVFLQADAERLVSANAKARTCTLGALGLPNGQVVSWHLKPLPVPHLGDQSAAVSITGPILTATGASAQSVTEAFVYIRRRNLISTVSLAGFNTDVDLHQLSTLAKRADEHLKRLVTRLSS
jgi:hypothetical protein